MIRGYKMNTVIREREYGPFRGTDATRPVNCADVRDRIRSR